jgi:hypothetical protein
MALNGRMTANYELERIWKEAILAYFKVLCQNLFSGDDENHGSQLLTRLFEHDTGLN